MTPIPTRLRPGDLTRWGQGGTGSAPRRGPKVSVTPRRHSNFFWTIAPDAVAPEAEDHPCSGEAAPVGTHPSILHAVRLPA